MVDNVDTQDPNATAGPMDNLEEALPEGQEMGIEPDGDELPAGAIPQDVADNVSVKASEGEYIIPANIVRFLGVQKLENLVSKAQAALQDMENNGRMGTQNEAKAADKLLPGYATGGLVQNPAASANSLSVQPVTAQYKGPTGDVINVQLINGQPSTPVPAGYSRVSTSTGQSNTALTPTQKASEQIQSNTAQAPTTSTPAATGVANSQTVQGTGQASTGLVPFNQGQQSDKDKEAPTGTNKPVNQWGADDYGTFANSQATTAGRLGDSFAKSFTSMALGPLGAFASLGMGYTEDRATRNLNSMIQTGVDMYGNPISQADMSKLMEAQARLQNPEEVTTAEKIAKDVIGSPMAAMADPVGFAAQQAVDKVVSSVKKDATDAVKTTEAGQKTAGLVDRVKESLRDIADRAVDASTGVSADNPNVGKGLVDKPDSTSDTDKSKESSNASGSSDKGGKDSSDKSDSSSKSSDGSDDSDSESDR